MPTVECERISATPVLCEAERCYLGNSHRSTAAPARQKRSGQVVPKLLMQIDGTMAECVDAGVDAEVDRYLLNSLGEFVQRPGKRLRPLLCLLACELVGSRAEKALSTAAALECFHAAALIHDDIEDNGLVRRGQPAFHRAEGTPLAVNAGDYGFVLTYKMVLDDPRLNDAERLAVVRALTEMAELTIKGQAIDLGWSRDGRFDITVEDYLAMARGKSACYSCSFPLTIGCIIGGGSDNQRAVLSGIGDLCGIAFQIEDDLSNLLDGDSTGKDALSDITEGKRTLIVAYALQHSSHAEELAQILGARTTDSRLTARALQIMKSCGALEYSAYESARMCREARGLLVETFARNEARDALEEVIRSIPSAWKQG